MVALVWGNSGEKFYETGIDRGVFYPPSGSPSVWNGLISVVENVNGGDQRPVYFDGQKRYDIIQSEDYQATVEAFAVPAGFGLCNGVLAVVPGLLVTQQPRQSFGFSYRTIKGNDVSLNDYSYKIHMVWNATASPTARTYKTTSDSVDLETMSWTIDTYPPGATTFKPTAHMVVDVSLITSAKRTALENQLYGTPSTAPSLPTQSAIIALLT